MPARAPAPACDGGREGAARATRLEVHPPTSRPPAPLRVDAGTGEKRREPFSPAARSHRARGGVCAFPQKAPGPWQRDCGMRRRARGVRANAEALDARRGRTTRPQAAGRVAMNQRWKAA